MRYLIDGYNLLHGSNVMGRSRAPGWLDQARERLLIAIEKHLDAKSLTLTAIVFDRHSTKPIDADSRRESGLRVFFATDHPEADDLIEELIRQHPHPKTLTVVSSDHRLHKAALRRKATPVDSDIWFDQLIGDSLRVDPADIREETFKEKSGDATSVDQWLNEFASKNRATDSGAANTKQRAGQEVDAEIYDPFPEGYAEDLLDDADNG